MTTLKRIRLVLTDPSANAPSTSSTSSSLSGSGSTSASAPATAPASMSTFDSLSAAPDADTSAELVQLLQAGISFTGTLATAAITTSSSATDIIPARAPALPTPLSSLTSSADAVLAALAGIYQPGLSDSSGNIGTSATLTMHNSFTTMGPPMPSTETESGTGLVPKKRSRKGKERAGNSLDQQNQQLGQGLPLGTYKVKRRRKTIGQDVYDSGSPGTSGGVVGSSSGAQEGTVALTSIIRRTRGRPRKDPSAPPRAPRRNAKGNSDKGKGRAKDTADNNDTDANATLPDSTTDKGRKDNGDSEFETDDDMVEIISSRIPPTQKRKIEVLENANNQTQQEEEEEEENEVGTGFGEENESAHEGYEGDDQIGSQIVAGSTSVNRDAGGPAAVAGRQYICSIFPTEVLQQILLCLPLSKIARLSRVSMAWLDAARVLPVWKVVCKKGELGEPRKKYKTYMALVCANSYWICEQCMSFSKGREHYADLPLPVKNEEDDHLVWMLCLACRIEYFARHPEPLKEDRVYRDEFAFVVQTKQLAPHSIFINYALRGENLRGVASTGRQDTKRQLFDRGAVQRRALEVHGGWVGVDACATNPGRKRAAICNERAKDCRLYKKKPLTKKRPPVPEEKREARREALEQRREEREDARQENWRQKLLWNRVTRLSKRHKWHTTANWRKNRYC